MDDLRDWSGSYMDNLLLRNIGRDELLLRIRWWWLFFHNVDLIIVILVSN